MKVVQLSIADKSSNAERKILYGTKTSISKESCGDVGLFQQIDL